ncbi:MAG TPA: DUF2752 domain-containing protein [Acidimicrobiales bacterium]|nr:DUF2752 domain-containing protein [Acidimicrobiales bacterium]
MASARLRLPAHLEARHLAVGLAGCAALGVVAVLDPSRYTLAPPCPLRLATGLDCPLCGATRATHALLRGDVGLALDFNALYVLALPVLAVVAGFWLVRGRRPAWAHGRALTWALVGVGLAFGVVRNLPWAPLAVLGSSP